MKKVENTVTNSSGVYPDTLAINASGAGATDGTEYTAEYINNFIFGISQAWLSYAGVVPNGVTESASNSQFIDATKKGFGVGTGIEVSYHFNTDPATLGYRILPLNRQGIIFANYPELDAVTYVGDIANAAVAAVGGSYYRASDAAGTTPNIAGPYLILPESRGYALRGLDTAATIDPDGASRYLGDTQGDTFQDFQVGGEASGNPYYGLIENLDLTVPLTGSVNTDYAVAQFRKSQQGNGAMLRPVNDGINGTPRVGLETRMVNRSTNYGVCY